MDNQCKGTCGQILWEEPCGIMIPNPPYKDGYCKDCYVKKLELIIRDVQTLSKNT